MPPSDAVGNAPLEIPPPPSAMENGEEPEPAAEDVGMTDLDQLLKSERKREKEEMEVPPLVSYHSISLLVTEHESTPTNTSMPLMFCKPVLSNPVQEEDDTERDRDKLTPYRTDLEYLDDYFQVG